MRRLLRVLLPLVLLLVVLAEMSALAWVDRWANLGVTWGLDQTPIVGTGGNPLGVNVFLEKETAANVQHSLDLVAAGGFQWIRQGFAWSDIEIAGKGDFVDRRNGPPVSAWAKYDFIVDQALARHIQILARLDAPPLWARPAPVIPNACGATDFSHSPPARNSDFADFVAAVVSRYRGKIRYFQIWNEPNLIGEWPPQPDPAEYTVLLKAAYTAAHAANPDAVVLMAPLAQTIAGGCNPNDLVFLQGMYDAGARPYFDLGGVMAYGLMTGPDDRRADFERINFSRPELTREVMVRNGDAAKGMWASEYGWISLPADWGTDPKNNPGIWGNATPEQQAAYLVGGYERARAEWPWMGVMFVWHLRDPAPLPHEPQPYFGILNGDFSPRPAYLALQAYSRRFPIADSGASTPASPAFATSGPWVERTLAGQPVYTATQPSSVATLTFQGDEAALVLAPGPAPVPAQMTLDGVTTSTLTVPAFGHSADPFQVAAAWPAPSGMLALQVPVATGIADTRHTLTIRPAASAAPLVLLGFVAGRAPAQGWLYAGAYLLLTGLALWLGVRVSSQFSMLNFRLGSLSSKIRSQDPGRLVLAGLVLTLTAYYLLPSERLALVALVAWLLLAILRPDLALLTTVATLPFYWAPRGLFQWTFPLSESGLWLTLLAWVLHRLLWQGLGVRGWGLGGSGWRGRIGSFLAAWGNEDGARNPAVSSSNAPQSAGARQRETLPLTIIDEDRDTQPVPRNAWYSAIRIPQSATGTPFALPALALLAVGAFSLLTVVNPDYLKSSLHAFRWVIVEPVLLYFLATDILPGLPGAYRLAGAYVAGATLAAALALALGVLQVPGSILVVQGVVRFQGLDTDPNNLALFLERGLAFALGLAILGRAPGTRQWMGYAAAAVIIAPALLLTYSRGAWLAVVVALGLILWLVGARAARIFAAVLVGGVVLGLGAAAAHLLPERILTLGSGLIRLDVWATSLQMIRDHPIFGLGLDQFYNQYQGPYFDPARNQGNLLSHPHNLILDCWLSLGIIGVLVAGWLAVRVVQVGRDLLRRGDPSQRALAGAALAGLTAMLVHGLVDNSYFLQDLALTFWLFCALLATA